MIFQKNKSNYETLYFLHFIYPELIRIYICNYCSPSKTQKMLTNIVTQENLLK